jgi:hypothetical protein
LTPPRVRPYSRRAVVSAWTITLLTAGVALVSGLISASINSWLTSRAKVNEELRVERLKAYPQIWERTITFSRWPRDERTYDDLRRFHLDLRDWYYKRGGLYMSENSRGRYGDVQELAAVELEQPPPPPTALSKERYERLMEACSAFRTGLTEDLESRRQRSLIWSIRKSREHKQDERAAKARVRAARDEAQRAARP